MGLNIHPGSLRHVIEWYSQPDGADVRGNPLAKIKVGQSCMANVRYASGNRVSSGDAQLTTESISVLTWYNPDIDNSNFVSFNGKIYEIQHIEPDEVLRGMIVTALLERDG